MTVLALGLFAAGLGTMPILRTALLSNINSSLTQLAGSAVGEQLFNISSGGESGPVFTPKANAPRTDYYVAVYGPDGDLLASAGGQGPDSPRPAFPSSFGTDYAYSHQGSIIQLGDRTGDDAVFHASFAVQQFAGSEAKIYTQMVARPLTEVERVVGTYFGIFFLVALVTIIGGALLTRWAVTLTFRRFGQVEATAMSIASGDFSQRLTDAEPSTEIGRLTTAINTMLDRIDGAIGDRDATVRQMRRFVGDASHELRTPLVSVRGYAELYRMGAIQGEPDTARAMERIEKEAIRMGVLVEDLLALARLDEKRELDIVPLDLRPLARDAALDVRVAEPGRVVTVVDTTVEALTGPIALPSSEPHADDAEAREARRRRSRPLTAATEGLSSLLRRRPRGPGDPATGEVPVDASASPGSEGSGAPAIPQLDFTVPQSLRPVAVPPIVLGEEHRVRQVIANLLGNARRFSPEGSPIEIEVGVSVEAHTAWIAVVDHGEGVPEAIRDQIFERFWRADTSRARETGGSGLGLAIVASIVEALHGSVSVQDTPGGGATFRVAFPLAPLAEADHALAETRPIPRIDDGS
ncbi:sensor histidine kinase [Microbacterium marinilacus]|uniref:histidine kinase n=1 Tax=Microbacterium marinilacus TaxID=415209 RepID=A0ABP7BE30_9MICO|nr:HAMP domain-containing sensor histidine kinase [Microbacterium marinilacus]